MKKDKPNAFPFPPGIYIVSIILGVVAGKYWPLKIAALPIARAVIGVLAILAGFAIIFSAMMQFKKTKNNPIPNTPAKSVVKTGPYSFTRNPMYTAWIIIQVGFGLALGNLWVMLALVPAVVLIHYTVILREEAYMTRAFGKHYKEYTKEVRRWI